MKLIIMSVIVIFAGVLIEFESIMEYRYKGIRKEPFYSNSYILVIMLMSMVNGVPYNSVIPNTIFAIFIIILWFVIKIFAGGNMIKIVYFSKQIVIEELEAVLKENDMVFSTEETESYYKFKFYKSRSSIRLEYGMFNSKNLYLTFRGWLNLRLYKKISDELIIRLNKKELIRKKSLSDFIINVVFGLFFISCGMWILIVNPIK